MTPEQDSYAGKKAFYDRVLTVYGRKPALEALQDESLECHTLHLANSNKQAGIIAELQDRAELRGVAVRRHSREALAHISRNGKQDQGVALDIVCPAFQPLAHYLRDLPGQPPHRLLALDGVSNPQNLGMIIRSAAAGGIDGIVYARKSNASLGPLVIKASAGTVYRAPLLRCGALPEALTACRDHGMEICTLQADAPVSLFAHQPRGHCVFVLGNETAGVSSAVSGLADTALAIPMSNGVESLNVAVTASLIAYAHYLER